MMYKVLKNGDAYEVLEKQTDMIVAKNLLEHEAKLLCKTLNFGGGFDGWTPEFFNSNFKITGI